MCALVPVAFMRRAERVDVRRRATFLFYVGRRAQPADVTDKPESYRFQASIGHKCCDVSGGRLCFWNPILENFERLVLDDTNL